ncbi:MULTISPECIES: chemotaxis protein CheB [Cyanophyceae]|uniref:chemotaxis protein CheB n=1 Tax=Cyanophyceae TaxID=3028117 RepID=UPI0016885CB0|nr:MULTISPECIES: chemotaxis protein CheB [Cyanophyceae]MBD1919252.1 chemotaxis protein CheB [Phormidium sp. FACHB-77]MBD2030954.1 chemotaxis protein CheB [Phormidium sp. FACHB-322]MBD2054275.1 chemotaxis protein CheB [Leptolyngbya sp. FACHB-60]
MNQKHPVIIVVGASAGGMQALKQLVAQFPKGFPASIFVVNHMGAETTGDVLVRALNESGGLTCEQAHNEQPFQSGHIYLAPADQHILLVEGKILVTKGARENRYRPAIDPLFRSAAVAYGNRVIGIILTGYLDDGTSGMMAIKRCGGLCIVQDPLDASYPDMPQSVIANVGADYCLPIAEMGMLLSELVQRKLPARKQPPKDIVIEAEIAQRVLSDLPSVEALGRQVPFNCPDCGGVLWQMSEGDLLRYRCHTGHAFTSAVLLAQQTAKIEETLWVALRMFEERQNLIATMGQKQGNSSSSVLQRVQDSQLHIDRIRAMLKATHEDDRDGLEPE